MGSIAPTQACWLVQPLLDAGLEQEEIQVLLYRLGFDAIARSDPDPMAPVSDRPAEVRAAWAEMIGRMIALADSGEAAALGSDRH